MILVLALGGSVVVPADDVDEIYVKEFSKLVKDLSGRHKLGIVIGGGKTARNAVEAARAAGKNEAECDYAGIDASRANAKAVAKIMGLKQATIPENFKEARTILEKKGIVIMGGTEPGHSTDAVAAILAEYCNADMILNLTNVDGVYDRDPRKFREAKLFKELPVKTLEQIVLGISQHAGKYELMDLVAVKIIQRSGVKCIALNGRNLKNIANAIMGKNFVGTVIS